MPLLRIFNHKEASVGLWKMADGEFDARQDDYINNVLAEANAMFKSNMRRMEYVCERALLREMLGGKVVEIAHNDDGKPLLENGYNISISHTRGYVAIILSEKHGVGIDIEYRSDRVRKISSRFMRDDEIADTTEELLVHWCAKETVYKLFSSDRLDFKDIKVVMGEPPRALNMAKNIAVDLHIESAMEYIQIYAVF